MLALGHTLTDYTCRWHGAAVVSTIALQGCGPGFESQPGSVNALVLP